MTPSRNKPANKGLVHAEQVRSADDAVSEDLNDTIGRKVAIESKRNLKACVLEPPLDPSTRQPTPILVVGMNRSGTKWLAATLACHSQIAGPTRSSEGRLLLDSGIFSALAHKFPDLTTYAEYRGFVEVWSATRLFKLIGGDKEALLNAQEWPNNCLHILRTTMSQFAVRSGASYWLLKGEPLNVRTALRFWPDAHVVLIRRGFVDVLRSRLRLFSDRDKPTNIAREAGLYALRERVMDRYAKRPNCIDVSFEAFKTHREQTLRYICDGIGIRFERAMLEFSSHSYVNTSFRHEDERSRVLTPMQERLATSALYAFRRVPLALLERGYDSVARRTVPPLSIGAFGALGHEE